MDLPHASPPGRDRRGEDRLRRAQGAWLGLPQWFSPAMGGDTRPVHSTAGHPWPVQVVVQTWALTVWLAVHVLMLSLV